MATKAKAGADLVSLSEIARLVPEITRNVLSDFVEYDLLPWHNKPGKKASRKYYRLEEVKRVLRAIEPLRAKEIPKKYLREELNRLSWYREMRARETADK